MNLTKSNTKLTKYEPKKQQIYVPSRESIEELILHLPFVVKDCFCGRLGCVLFCGGFGVRETIEFLLLSRPLFRGSFALRLIYLDGSPFLLLTAFCELFLFFYVHILFHFFLHKSRVFPSK